MSRVKGIVKQMDTKIYTKTGDKGTTSLLGGTRVSKTHHRLEVYGTIDELNSALGVVFSALKRMEAQDKSNFALLILKSIDRVQAQLFSLGSQFACEHPSLLSKLPHVIEEDILTLEQEIDAWEASMPALKNFILPGTESPSALVHLARTICRRGERLAAGMQELLTDAQEKSVWDRGIIYLNRLSDWLFTMARYLDHKSQAEVRIWKNS